MHSIGGSNRCRRRRRRASFKTWAKLRPPFQICHRECKVIIVQSSTGNIKLTFNIILGMQPILSYCRGGMDALAELGDCINTHPRRQVLLQARNVLMVRIMLRNGQRSGAITNMTVGEFQKRRRVEEDVVIRVRKHKTNYTDDLKLILGIWWTISSSHLLKSFTADTNLDRDMETWMRCRKLYLMAKFGSEMASQEDFFFCSAKGTQMCSSELPRITGQHVGGNVSDMRKAQYHLVN